MSGQDLYHGREQTFIKHFILQHYLQRFARIIGFGWSTITYVDCFSGPWKSQSEELKDTSFAVALDELRKARAFHAERGKDLQIRCMFLERDAAAYARLNAFTDKVTDVRVETKNKELAEAIADVLDFIGRGGSRSFAFIFIDPTGWTGFEMDLIAPLLQARPGEVLINFMTDYIRRFIYHPDQETRNSFAKLFGSEDFKTKMEQLPDPLDREEALFQAYATNVKKTGKFSHTCAAIVLHPEVDRSYFHLIYATRDRKGVEVFKEVEKRAMTVMEQTRVEAKQRKRVKKTRQPELFAAMQMPHSTPVAHLRQRYLEKAKTSILGLLHRGTHVPFEEAWDLALSFPLVWDSDLKDWIDDWKPEGLRIEGLKPRQRVPKLNEKNILVWQQ